MPLISMTGFGRAEGSVGGMAFQIEARCVNGRSADIKVRLPAGLESLDADLRKLFQTVVRRGNANVSVSLQRTGAKLPRINTAALGALREALAAEAHKLGEPAPAIRDMLSLPGIVEMVEPALHSASGETSDGNDDDPLSAALLAGAEDCAAQLAQARAMEGRKLQGVLEDLVSGIEAEVEALAALPEARGAGLHERLTRQLNALLESNNGLEPQRLHQEVALLVSKTDIEEELARLRAHISAARELLQAEAPVGRKLDFLAQEFNREANTICSKASAIAVTQKGLALKALIDQVKEQVQNVE